VVAALGLLAAALLVPAGAYAHDKPLSLNELLAEFEWDFDTAEIRTEKVTDGLYVLFGLGGNIGVSIGAQGVLIVDDQFPQMISKIGDAIRAIGGGGVDFAINTHWHFDHAEGNLALGPAGTWLVSQANSRRMMLDDHLIDLVTSSYEQKAYPTSALPAITYDDTMQFHFNDETIELLHPGPAHTTGDTAVIFRGSNAVPLGDVFNRSGYPFIDAGNGGDLRGMIDFCQAVLDAIDETTVVIPGHGEISDYAGLQAYIDMLEDMHQTIGKMVKRGKSLEEVVAANPTAKYDAENGDSTNFVNRAYTSLQRELGK
jgi:glyoxylase-like metal-dependent hydrolase (beta-lactamase superfamily II)